MTRKKGSHLVGLIFLLSLLCAGCAETEVKTKTGQPPMAYLELTKIHNDFGVHLPNVTEFDINGKMVRDYSLRLLFVENGKASARGRLDGICPETQSLEGRTSLMCVSRPDPEGNPKALWPDQIYGFRLANRVNQLSPKHFGDIFDVRGKKISNSQIRSAGPLAPGEPQVLFVMWFEPLFHSKQKGFSEDAPPPTLDEIKERTAKDKKRAAVVLVLMWRPK